MKTILLGICLLALHNNAAGQLSGLVKDNSNNTVSAARITVFNSDTSFFSEARSNGTGNFQFSGLPNGNYFVGASHPSTGYVQSPVIINGATVYNITLPPDTAKGQWNILVNSPEPLGGTNLAILMPDGNIFFCHNTKDPFYFNPRTNLPEVVAGDTKVLGCVGLGMMNDGKIIFFGGADREVYGPGTKNVKTFNPVTRTWSATQALLKKSRWYPTTIQLPNGKWLVAGGGDENNPNRTNTSEVFDPTTNTSMLADTVAKGNEVSPITMLYNGKVLMTHRPPQLFDQNTLQWEPTGDFVQGNRMPNGDHSDHEIVLLPEGNVVAIGYKSFSPGLYGNMVEIYNPASGTWSLGTNNTPIRSRTKSILLPNKKILVLGGEKENPADPTPVNAYKYTSLAHYYDPYSNTWKQLRNMNYAREYHATAIVVPDGRIIVTGGEGQPGNEPSQSIIEAFTPPYLLKGIRPQIVNLNKTEFARNESISFDLKRANAPTKVILMSLPVVTHFMSSGHNRFVELSFTQTGNRITAAIPSNQLQAPDGYYTLLAMADDIPSQASIIKISGITTGLPDSAVINSFKIYPNPTSGKFWVELDSRIYTPAVFQLYDAKGSLVMEKNSSLVFGKNTIAFNEEKLSDGTYILLLRTKTIQRAEKLILSKDK